MIIVFTGNGKGKTTAALGQMIRVIGQGKNALMLQFIKGPWRSGEDYFSDFFENLKKSKVGRFKIKKGGLGFVGILGDKLPIKKHKEMAKKTLQEFKKATKENWHLIVLDEINVALNLNLLSKEEILKLVKKFPKDKILVLTGRNAPRELINSADLVTEMKEIKHPFILGKKAKITIEF